MDPSRKKAAMVVFVVAMEPSGAVTFSVDPTECGWN